MTCEFYDVTEHFWNKKETFLRLWEISKQSHSCLERAVMRISVVLYDVGSRKRNLVFQTAAVTYVDMTPFHSVTSQ